MNRKDPKIAIAKRVAKEFKNNYVVNLGFGLPLLSARYISPETKVWLHSENGILGMGLPAEKGQEDPELIDAGGNYTSLRPGGSYTDCSLSFGIIRGGHVDISVLGALQVDRQGNLANWMIPDKLYSGMGGAMDLTAGARKVIVAMKHNLKDGSNKILEYCTLPLTASREVNLIITELAVIEVTASGLVLNEISERTSVEEVQNRTGAALTISRKLKTF